MSDDPTVRTSVASATFLLMGVEIVGHVLDDGTRIIDAGCVEALMRAMASPDAGARVDLLELQRFSDWQRGTGPIPS